MFLALYKKFAVLIAPFFLLTSIVLFLMCVWRGEIILGLQSKLSERNDQKVTVVVEQQKASLEISHKYEERKADRTEEKEENEVIVEKIVSVPTYSSECFDSAGLQHIAKTISTLNSTGKLEHPVSEDKGAD